MEYSSFRKLVEDTFKSFLSEQYKDTVLEIRKIPKINQILDGLTLIRPDGIYPMIYIQDMYHEYMSGTTNANPLAIIKDMADIMMTIPDLTISMDNKSVIFQVVNYAQSI